MARHPGSARERGRRTSFHARAMTAKVERGARHPRPSLKSSPRTGYPFTHAARGRGGIGRRNGLKIRRAERPVPVRVRPPAPNSLRKGLYGWLTPQLRGQLGSAMRWTRYDLGRAHVRAREVRNKERDLENASRKDRGTWHEPGEQTRPYVFSRSVVTEEVCGLSSI